eukprot:541156_1
MGAGVTLLCDGTFSCAKCSNINVQSQCSALGSNAAAGSTIMSSNILCYGDQSCSGSTISAAQNINQYRGGAYSLINSIIDSNGISGNTLSIKLAGYFESFGSTLICRDNHICNIDCLGITSCAGMQLICMPTSTCNIVPFNDPNQAVLLPNTTNYDIDLIINSSQIAELNDVRCNNNLNTITYDANTEFRNGQSLSTNSTICCRGSRSCKSTSTRTIEVIGIDQFITCSGHDSCSQAETNLINYNGSIYCTASDACTQSVISAKTLYCLGDMSCQQSNIQVVSNLYCTARRSCRLSTIGTIDTGTIVNIYALGDAAMDSAVVTCAGNDICNIFCGAYQSCVDISCTGDCHYHFTYPFTTTNSNSPTNTDTPTTNPSSIPTNQPSTSPTTNTKDPTTNTLTPTTNTKDPTTNTVAPSRMPIDMSSTNTTGSTATQNPSPTTLEPIDVVPIDTVVVTIQFDVIVSVNVTDITSNLHNITTRLIGEAIVNISIDCYFDEYNVNITYDINVNTTTTTINAVVATCPEEDVSNINSLISYFNQNLENDFVYRVNKQNVVAIIANSITTLVTSTITTPFCAELKLQFTDSIAGMSTDAVEHMTKTGISDALYNYGMNERSFYVEFIESDGNLFIYESLCVFKEQALGLLCQLIGIESNQIETHITDSVIVYFESNNLIINNNIKLNLSVINCNDEIISTMVTIFETKPPMDQQTDFTSLYISGGIVILFLLFAIISCIDAKFCRINNFYSIKYILKALFELLDVTSDVLFAITITILYLNDNEISKFSYAVLPIILSYLFIIVPAIATIIQLFQQIHKHWLVGDVTSNWLSTESNILYAIALITGSGFTAIYIVNCNAFKLKIFSMGLSRKQIIKFETKRIYSVVLLENLPQAMIQIWYLTTVAIEPIAVASVTFSFISIIITILTNCTQKRVIDNQQSLEIEFDVLSDQIDPKFTTKVKQIQTYVAKLLAVSDDLTEITKPKIISNGVRIKILIYVKSNASTNYEQIVNDALNNGQLEAMIQEDWKLEDTPTIQNIYVKEIMSKVEYKNTVATGIDNQIELTTNQTEKQQSIVEEGETEEIGDNIIKK